MKKRKNEIVQNATNYIEAIDTMEKEYCALSSNEDFKKDIYEKVKPYINDELINLSLEEVDLNEVDPTKVNKRGNVNVLYFKILNDNYSFNSNSLDDTERLFRLKSLNGKYYFLQNFGNNTFHKYKKTKNHIYLKSSEGYFMPFYYFDEEGRYTASIELSFRLTILLDIETLRFSSYSIELLEPNISYDITFYSIFSPNLFNDYEDDIRSIYFNTPFSNNTYIENEKLSINDLSINFDLRYNSYLNKIKELGLDIDTTPLDNMTREDYKSNHFIDYAMVYPKVLEFCVEAKDEDLTQIMKKIELSNYILKNASFDSKTIEFYFNNKENILQDPIYIKKYLLVEALSNDSNLELGIVSIEDLDSFDLDDTFQYSSSTKLILLSEMISSLNPNIKIDEVLNYIRRIIVNQGIFNMNPYIEYVFYILKNSPTENVETEMFFPPSLLTQLSKLKFDNKYKVFKDYDENHFLSNIDCGEAKYNKMLEHFNMFKLEGYRFELLKSKEDINSKIEKLFIRDSYLLQGGEQKLFFAVYKDGAKKPLGVGKLGRSVNRIAGLNQRELNKVMIKLNNIIDRER